MKNNKIVGIGNAIVDIVCEIESNFLKKNSLIRGSMSLIDEMMAQKLSKLPSIKITSGGSVANSMATIAQLNCDATFIGKVAYDDFGRKFIDEIEKNGVKFASKKFANSTSAKSFILVDQDAQRTMCTFLGCASEIYEEDINDSDLKNAKILYLEGYLWDKEDTILSLKKAISLAKNHNTKIAFTLSDSFCVARHKQDFLKIIKNDLDILFANEHEIKELLNIENIEENNFRKLREFFIKNKKLIAVITRSHNGCIVFTEGFCHNEKAHEINKLVDTTGAGDSFAAGFLYGFINEFNLEKSAKLGNLLAAQIIQKFGARFDHGEIGLKILTKI